MHVSSGKCLLIEPDQGIIQLHITRWMSCRKLLRDCAVDFRLKFLRIKIGRWNVQLFHGIGQWRNAVISRKGDPHISQPNLMAEKIEESRELTIEIEGHLLHLRRIRPDLMTKDIVWGKA